MTKSEQIAVNMLNLALMKIDEEWGQRTESFWELYVEQVMINVDEILKETL